MKKFFVVMLILCFCFCVYGADLKAPAKAVTPEVTAAKDWERLDKLWNDFRQLQKDIKKLSDEKKFIEAADGYQKYIDAAKEINDPKRTPSLIEWGLNNKADMYIEEHKKDQKGSNALDLMNKAKELLEEAKKGIENAQPECKRCIESNMSYVNDWLKILSKEEPKIVAPEKKK